MLRIKSFIFNTFQVNCYILYDESGEAVVVDAGCFDPQEVAFLRDFLSREKLRLVRNLNTHTHIDHILGNHHIAKHFGINPEFHQDGTIFFHTVHEIAASFGYTLNGIPEPKGFLADGEIIRFGNSELKVLHTPGHADGSICLYHQAGNLVLTGDVIFRDTIGRTDLPTGNFDLLMKSIREKLFVLPDDTVVYPGHGPETTIGYEKMNNPFIR